MAESPRLTGLVASRSRGLREDAAKENSENGRKKVIATLQRQIKAFRELSTSLAVDEVVAAG